MALRRTKRTDKRYQAGQPWTEAGVARLVKLYPKMSNRDLAVEFGRPVWGIVGKARGMDLKKDYSGGYRRQLCMNPEPWSSEDEELLCSLYPSTPNEEIAEILSRSLDAIQMKSRRLGLRKMEFWSEAEDELLKKLYKKLSYEELAERLERTKGAVQIRIIVLGLECKVDNWTKNEIYFLKRNYRSMDIQTIAEKLGRTYKAVAVKARRAGLVKKDHWFEADVQRLKQLYASFTSRQIAAMMGRSYNSVRNQIRSSGLRKKANVAKEDNRLVFKLAGDDFQRRSEAHAVAANPLDKSMVRNADVAVVL